MDNLMQDKDRFAAIEDIPQHLAVFSDCPKPVDIDDTHSKNLSQPRTIKKKKKSTDLRVQVVRVVASISSYPPTGNLHSHLAYGQF